MTGRHWILSSLLLISSIASADLPAKFAEELALDPDQVPIAPQVIAEVQARPVVMFAGVLNEWYPRYFEDNADSLDRDFGQREIRRFFPSSMIAVEENAPRVNAWIRKSWKDFGRRPLLLICHSKGSAEALLAVMRDPTLVRDGIVDRLILVQTPVGGSHIADLLQNTDAGDWPAARPFRWLFRNWKGLRSLTTAASRPRFPMALSKLNPDDVALISQKVFFVRAFQEHEKTAWQLQAMRLFIENFYGESDGVLKPEDQLIEGFGTDLGVLDSDHFDLTETGPHVNSPASYRRAFTRALLRQIFE
jgi:hypothetical protein